MEKLVECLGSAFCCSPCPFKKASSTSRWCYFFISIVFLVTCIVVRSVNSSFQNLPFCKGRTEHFDECKDYSHYLLIYRIGFSFSVFFFLLFLVLIGVNRSRDYRSCIQNGWWSYKVIFLITLTVGSLYVPVGIFDTLWMICGLTASLIFNLFELLIFMQLSRLVTKFLIILWFQGSVCAFTTLVLYTLLCVCFALFIAIFLLLFYENCTLNLTVIILHSLTSYFLIAAAICVEQVNQRIGVLQGGIMSIQIMALSWFAMAHDSDPKCARHTNASIVAFKMVNLLSLFKTVVAFTFVTIHSLHPPPEPTMPTQILEERTRHCFCIYGKRKIVQSTSPTSNEEITEGPPPQRLLTQNYATTEERDDEYQSTKYHWSTNHIIYATGLMSIMMSLTDWYEPGWPPKAQIQHNETAMWFKLVTCWVCFVAYLHFLCLPSSYTSRLSF